MEISNARKTLRVHNADLSESSFDDVNCQRLTFTNVNLSGANFEDVNLTGVSIGHANSTGMKFDDVNCQGLTCTNVNLSGANFEDVNLTGVSIRDANLTGMKIEGILVSDLMRAYRKRAGAVVYAKNFAALQAFYQTVAGLEIEDAERDHVNLASPAFRLTVLKIPEQIAASIEIKNPPELRTETPIKLVFEVASIAVARTNAALHGGALFATDKEWSFEGYRVCDGYDPEGNVVQFRQREC